MLTYNTQLKKLILPEYGRNIQSMVEHCLTLEDRDERSHCARSIIKAMGNLFPELRDNENNRKLWDHLVIMSDFRLDVDFPCEVITAESLSSQPTALKRESSPLKYRHYGRTLHEMVQRAASMEDGEEKDALILYLANHMKKLMLSVNKDGVEDEKIFRDLYELSDGRIRLDETTHLFQFQEAPSTGGKKKKKK